MQEDKPVKQSKDIRDLLSEDGTIRFKFDETLIKTGDLWEITNKINFVMTDVEAE